MKSRYPVDVADAILPGPVVEKSIAWLRSSVVEKMSYGQLFLAGDAAHILPPTGAKGLNLGVADVVYLSRALISYYHQGTASLLEGYSDKALRRTWHAMRMAWYMTNLMHSFPNASEFEQQTQKYEWLHLKSSDYAQAALAELYAGLGYD